MTRTGFWIVCCSAAMLIACGKDKESKSGGGGGGGEAAAVLPAKTTWQLDEFLVDIETPKGWVFWDVDASFGKVLFAHTDGDFAESTLTVVTTCAGSCTFDKFPANIAESAKEAFEFAGDGAKWDKQPTEVKPGVWAYRFTGKGMRGDKVVINVSHIDKRVDDSFLACSAELVKDDMALADQIEALCTNLSFDVKDSGKPIEALFAGKYTLEEFTLEIPNPPGWKFDAYSIQWGKVTFKRGFGTNLEVGATCGGRCKEDRFPTAIEDEAKQAFESLGRDGEATWVKPFTEVQPGIWMHRIRRTTDGKPEEERIKVAATRKGAKHYFYCRADLSKDDLGLADAMEKYCLDRAAAAAAAR